MWNVCARECVAERKGRLVAGAEDNRLIAQQSGLPSYIKPEECVAGIGLEGCRGERGLCGVC